jgi:hypothetical protein
LLEQTIILINFSLLSTRLIRRGLELIENDLGEVSADSAFRDFFSHGGNYWVERFC